MLTRRTLLALPSALCAQSSASAEEAIETHLHLFDAAKFPYHANAPYQPGAYTLAQYLEFAPKAAIRHCVIVHPEPYQDDHRYLEYCFANESPKGFFKGTCLFDPIDPKTPGRLAELRKRNPDRIVALRIHAMNEPGEAPLSSGAIKNRDLRHPQMKATWKAASDQGVAIQMHFLPHHSPEIGKLAAEFGRTPVILDHLGRFGMGGRDGLGQVLRLADNPEVYLKFSGAGYSSKQGPPYSDLVPAMRRFWSAFGPERILWGGVGQNEESRRRAEAMLRSLFAFAKEEELVNIRRRNAARLFGFQ